MLLVGAAAFTLLLFARAFVRLRRRGRVDHAGWARIVLFVAAVALGTVPLLVPIGDESSLAAHMLEHVSIGDAAPALALVALRGPLFFCFLPRFALRRVHRWRPVLAFLDRPAVAVAVWLGVMAAWHVPVAYDSVLPHRTVHDLEHLSFMVAGLLVWLQIVDPARRRTPLRRLGVMIVLFCANAVFAFVLVLSPQLYPAYPNVLDQQLAGLVMLAAGTACLGLCAWFLCLAEAENELRVVGHPVRRPRRVERQLQLDVLHPGHLP
jgi:cytochrome c oxidase assembly factor CtaG